jgi:DNA topoisomerase-1
MALNEFQKFDTQAGPKRNIREAINRVAARLGNTATICRKCYVHPEILTTYVEGSLLLEVKERVEAELREDLPGLKPEEAAVLGLLQQRLSTTLKDKLVASMKRLSPIKARKAAHAGRPSLTQTKPANGAGEHTRRALSPEDRHNPIPTPSDARLRRTPRR